MIYDLSRNKQSLYSHHKDYNLVLEIKQDIDTLTPRQAKRYDKYKKQCLEIARKREIYGKNIPYPSVPRGISKKLDYKYAEQVYDILGL